MRCSARAQAAELVIGPPDPFANRLSAGVAVLGSRSVQPEEVNEKFGLIAIRAGALSSELMWLALSR
eukprot:15438756-Alexandrium_andersonii.AAC.1